MAIIVERVYEIIKISKIELKQSLLSSKEVILFELIESAQRTNSPTTFQMRWNPANSWKRVRGSRSQGSWIPASKIGTTSSR